MLPSLHFLTGNTGQSVRWQGRAMPAGTSGRPVQAMMKPSLDGYRIGRIIGEGRAATVYLADDLRRGGNVALKFLKGSCGESEAIRQGFAAECAILSAIQHKHVVRVIEHRTGSAPCCLTMEYLGGGNLRERMRRGIGPGQAFELLRQAAAGLAQVHRLQVVHRDLKPENFLMRWPGEMVLIDFGVAAGRGDSAARVAPGRLVGTAAYTAPEQSQGEPPDGAADVYSLGIVFYEMLRGRRPFAATTVLEALSQH
ncbi:MAG: serine/threonine-protein kinase, partial [Ramlibacter sp.]